MWPSGRKVYTVMSRVKGRLRRISIGTHGTITAEKARARAHELLSEAKNGRDPAKELDQARKAPTMKGLGERFLREHVALRCKPTTHSEYKRSVELFINPKLGTRKVTDIERKDIAELHHELQHLFPCCDAGIFPSIVKEAGPLVFLEALASGCFPLGTYFAGMKASIDGIADLEDSEFRRNAGALNFQPDHVERLGIRPERPM